MTNIIIIDGDAKLRDSLEFYFKQKRYHVTVYSSAQEACTNKKELEASHAILCDLMMDIKQSLQSLNFYLKKKNLNRSFIICGRA